MNRKIFLVIYTLFFAALFFYAGAAFVKRENKGTQLPEHTSTVLDTSTGFSLTLIDGHQEALLNGDTVSLEGAPFVSGGAFYYPLQPVVEMLGGTYTEQGDVAEVCLFGHEITFQTRTTIVSVDGTEYEGPEEMCGFSLERESVQLGGDITPQLFQGIFYVPYGMIPKECPDFCLNHAREDPEAGTIIFSSGIQNESGVDAVKLRDDYLALGEDFRTSLKDVGAVGKVIGYDIEKYQNDDIEVYVMRNSNNEEDAENMDGKVCAIRLLSSKYATPRGLRVGDSPYRACLLYSRDSLDYTFSYSVEDGAVASISFYTNYFSFSR